MASRLDNSEISIEIRDNEGELRKFAVVSLCREGDDECLWNPRHRNPRSPLQTERLLRQASRCASISMGRW